MYAEKITIKVSTNWSRFKCHKGSKLFLQHFLWHHYELVLGIAYTCAAHMLSQSQSLSISIFGINNKTGPALQPGARGWWFNTCWFRDYAKRTSLIKSLFWTILRSNPYISPDLSSLNRNRSLWTWNCIG